MNDELWAFVDKLNKFNHWEITIQQYSSQITTGFHIWIIFTCFPFFFEVDLPCHGSPECPSFTPRPRARSWWGVEPKARVVIFAETQLNWMVAAFATWCLNGQVPISEKIWQRWHGCLILPKAIYVYVNCTYVVLVLCVLGLVGGDYLRNPRPAIKAPAQQVLQEKCSVDLVVRLHVFGWSHARSQVRRVQAMDSMRHRQALQLWIQNCWRPCWRFFPSTSVRQGIVCWNLIQFPIDHEDIAFQIDSLFLVHQAFEQSDKCKVWYLYNIRNV